jgi:tetratricopeptide (TPR) repeat protein
MLPILLLVAINAGMTLSAQEASAYERAIAAFRQHDFQKASALFAEAEGASPGKTDAPIYEARALVNLQRYPAAEKVLLEYAKAHSEDAEPLYLLGYIMFRENKPQESLEIYTRAAAITGPKADDLKIVALDYVLLDDNTSAVRWLRKAVEFDPKNAEAWYFLGRSYYSASRFPEAENAFHTALGVDPRYMKAENNLGVVYEAENRPADALAAYETAIAWQQADAHRSEQPYLNRGKLLVEQNRAMDALPPLREAVSIAPNCAACHEALARALQHAGRNLEARSHLEQAVELEPKNASFHFELGRLYQKTGDTDRAKRELDLSKQMYGEKTSPAPQERPTLPQDPPPPSEM